MIYTSFRHYIQALQAELNMGLDIYFVTYNRSYYTAGPRAGKQKPFHWAFFIPTGRKEGRNPGIAFQLRGMPGAFRYVGPEMIDDLDKSSTKEAELQIGEIKMQDFEKAKNAVHDVLKTVGIKQDESSHWNCQNWALMGSKKLEEAKVLDAWNTPEGIKTWLRTEKGRSGTPSSEEPDSRPVSRDGAGTQPPKAPAASRSGTASRPSSRGGPSIRTPSQGPSRG